jgi:putative endonuclease
MMDSREIGALGEKIAAEYLTGLGYVIRERNFRSREGEIDIIAEKDDFLVFIEVRTRTSSSYGTPEESVTAQKKERLLALAEAYRENRDDLPPSWRVDVVALELRPKGEVSRLELIENAISPGLA